jgi:hypothetical protein
MTAIKPKRNTEAGQLRVGNTSKSHAGVPLMASVARRIILELFGKQSQWKTKALAREVEKIHLDRGGLKGAQTLRNVVNKALGYLLEDGQVENPEYGIWCGRATGESKSEPVSDVSGNAVDEGAISEADELVPEETLGDGTETVYLYYSPNDRELAKLKGRDTWECKIGHSATGKAADRILGQRPKTALSHPPLIGLEIRTDDSAALEQALHASLRLVEKEVPDSPGTEWFFTSPSRVEAWFLAYQASLTHLREA